MSEHKWPINVETTYSLECGFFGCYDRIEVTEGEGTLIQMAEEEGWRCDEYDAYCARCKDRDPSEEL